MKICVVNITTEESSGDADRFFREYYPKVTRQGTEVGLKYASPGFVATNANNIGYTYFRFLYARAVIEKLIEAEKEGYDAAVINCFTDMGVREAREILNIPVIGPAEASMLLACQLGAKFGVIGIPIPKYSLITEALIRLYGLEDRAIVNPTRIFSLPKIDLFVNCLKDPKIIERDLLDRSEELVQCGAEVIIIGCCNMGPVATMANVVKVGDKDIPILDCAGVAVKTAEMMVDMKAGLGIPTTSRAGIHIQPRDKDFKNIRADFGL